MARRSKSPLVRLMRSEEYLFETTEERAYYWFKVLNREFFDNKLSWVDEVDIRWRRGTHAYHMTYLNKDGSVKKTSLHLNKKYKSEQFFCSVLFHEILHHWQALNNEPIGHGSSFWQWEKIARKHNMEFGTTFN